MRDEKILQILIASIIDNFHLAPHSSIIAWKIPWMEEPGGLPSMGLLSTCPDTERAAYLPGVQLVF